MKKSLFCLAVALILVTAPRFVGAEVKIGFQAPLTGWAAADGQSALRGAQLAVAFLNEDGGINGEEIKLVYYDDRVEAKESVLVARKLIESDGVTGVVSGSYSTPTRAAAPIYDRSGIPYISTIGTHPEIPLDRKYVFQTAVVSQIHGRVGAKVASENLNAKTAVMLNMDNDFGLALSEGFREKSPEFGIKILNEHNYPLGEKDFRSLLGRIKEDSPDVLWATGYYEEAAQIVKQAKEMGVQAIIIGQEGYDSPKFFELAGAATDGVVITTNLDRDSKSPVAVRFFDAYMKKHNVAADMVAASAFDGIMVLAHAIKVAGTQADKIVEAIFAIKDFESAVTGPLLSFDKQGVVSRPIAVQIVKDQAFKRLTVCSDPALIAP